MCAVLLQIYNWITTHSVAIMKVFSMNFVCRVSCAGCPVQGVSCAVHYFAVELRRLSALSRALLSTRPSPESGRCLRRALGSCTVAILESCSVAILESCPVVSLESCQGQGRVGGQAGESCSGCGVGLRVGMVSAVFNGQLKLHKNSNSLSSF